MSPRTPIWGFGLLDWVGAPPVIDSSTQEEATSQVFNWVRQRSRWVKGYIQTYLVHMRRPIQLWRELGTKGFFSFNMVIGGTFLSFLLNPLLYLLTTLWYFFHPGILHTLFPTPVFYLGITSLFVGNFTFVYLNLAGCLRPGYYDKVKYALISPLYWALMSWQPGRVFCSSGPSRSTGRRPRTATPGPR